jgi:Pyruvate/2-oxoacid:ferredoxin oxidoreductase gamma subunit
VEREILLTGIGGQGVQLAAEVLARAAIREGREVTSLGTYGGTMRGGNTDATLILGDAAISAPPVVSRAWAGVGAHPRYWDGVRARLRPGGFAVWNADLFGAASEAAASGPARGLPVHATALATRAGSAQAAALVLIAALAGASGLVGLDALLAAAEEALPSYRREQTPKNAAALRAGFAAASAPLAAAWSAA